MLFFLAYTHRYGTDVSMYSTEDLAYKSACTIIADWFHDISHDYRSDELRTLINTGKYFAAVVLWNQISLDCELQETITVGCSPLITEVDTPIIEVDDMVQEETG
jgi:hypothetical protein